jgi:hypothetical protein
MKIATAGEWIAAVAEGRREPARDRPDGRVASASERRRSTPVRTPRPVLDRAEDIAHDGEGRVARSEGAAEKGARNRAAHRAVLDAGRQSLHRAARGGIDRGGDADPSTAACSAEICDELPGRLAVALVLDRQPGVGGGEVIERGFCTPSGTKPNQDRKRQRDDGGRKRRPQWKVNRRMTPLERSATTME